MKNRWYCRRRGAIVLVFFLMLPRAGAIAADSDVSQAWQRVELLDEQTRADLSKCEGIFARRHKMGEEYTKASESRRFEMVRRWTEEVQSGDQEQAAQAAALLGIVKAHGARSALEKTVSATRSNRVRWVAVRSLGQIADKRSVGVLIELLDHVNFNVRTYAKASLCEITGVYVGGDKELWRKWLRQKSSALGSAEGGREQKTVKEPRGDTGDGVRLQFSLPDAYGRRVHSEDYKGAVVLLEFGASWCGGCQQEACFLRPFTAKYGPRGLQVVRVMSGDNELAAVEFQKHYRLTTVSLLDANREFERRYNRDGWPFLILADKDGRIVCQGKKYIEDDMKEIRPILDKLLSGRSDVRTIMRDGVAYMPPTLTRSKEGDKQQRWDRFPSLACGSDGRIYVVFTSNRNGNSDVFMRVFEGESWSQDRPVVATGADEYDGTVVVDRRGRAWISYCSDLDSKYNIFVAELTDPAEPVKGVQLTRAYDDAMHARMACDDRGRVWITYYKWRKSTRAGQSLSRDREVYVRCRMAGGWSDEIQVSPADVPWYEDHFDPVIIGCGGGSMVCWSWDFHPPNPGYPTGVEAPTIFCTRISGSLRVNRVIAVSGRQIDVSPAITVGRDGTFLCAWDSLGGGRKRLYVSRMSPDGRRRGEASDLTGPVTNVCTPCFAEGANDDVTLVWSETSDGRDWTVKLARFNAKLNLWSKPLELQSKGNPRFCSVDCDKEGKLWLCYSAQTGAGSEIIVRQVQKEELAGLSYEGLRKTGEADSGGNHAIKKLRRAIDERYSYRGLRGLDWGRLFERYEPAMRRARTAEEFAGAAAEMLARARDKHIWVKIGDRTIGSFKERARANYNLSLLREVVPNWRDLNDSVSTGLFEDGVGYIMIKSWARQRSGTIEAACKALEEFADTPKLIIDVRPNSGGAEPLAQEFAGCFVQEPVVYAKHVLRDASQPGGFSNIRERVLQPNQQRRRYRGRIAVLMGPVNMSSCEAFLLMMRQVPGCKLVGATSCGSSGNPKPVDLENGVTVWLPSWKALRPDGTCFEGEGIKPDVRVGAGRRQLSRRDPVLEAALRLLRKP